MMPVSDLFSRAGITFWDCAHEANAGLMCDGYSRVTGKIAMAIAQNGPGVTGFVTAVKTAYWNHTPMLLVTPQAANKTMGQGGFQEVPQMALFQDMVCWQEEVRDPSRIAEALNRVIAKALRGGAPAQINVPQGFLDARDRRRTAAGRAVRASRRRQEGHRRSREDALRCGISGHPEWRRRGARGRNPADDRAGGAARCAGLLGLSAQRFVSREPPVGGGAARLQRFQGRDGADRQGRCRARARHASQSVLHPARLRHRLLASRCEADPGRHERRPHRPDQESVDRHLRRREASGRADSRATLACRGRPRAGGTQGD